MTDRELMQQALKILKRLVDQQTVLQKEGEEITAALRERLAQPEPAPGYCPHCKQYTIEEPTRREWVGLTEAEKVNVAISCGCADVAWVDFADAIEAKLKEKNA